MLKFKHIDPLVFSKLAIVFEIAIWIVLGSTAMLWWLPEYLGEKHAIPLRTGAVFLFLLWALVLNHWPRLGTRRFFAETSFLKLKVVLLIIISAGFCVGLFVVAK